MSPEEPETSTPGCRLSVVLRIESATYGFSQEWELDDSQTVQFVEWLLRFPGKPPAQIQRQMTPALRIIEQIDKAYDALGKPVVTLGELTQAMLSQGWITRSKNPVSVVGVTLGGGRHRYVRTEGGWKRNEVADE